MKLSILIASIYERRENLAALQDELQRQILSLPIEQRNEVEVLTFQDDKRRSIGAKRNCLIDSALGEYVVFIDDDDSVSSDYVESILSATIDNPDCITFCSDVTQNGSDAKKCIYSIGYAQDENTRKEYHRIPNHLCAVKRGIASVGFPDKSFGEDSEFAKRIKPYLKSENHIEKSLYRYDCNQDRSSVVMADIIIVSDARNDQLRKMTQNTVNSCFATSRMKVNIIVMERSDAKYDNCTTINHEMELNYNHIANVGASLGSADNIVICNNDLSFHRNWLHPLINCPADIKSPMCPNLKRHTRLGHDICGYDNGIDFCGWCFCITRDFYNAIGGFDERVNFWCSDDIVIEQAKQRGSKPRLVIESKVDHLRSQTLGDVPDPEPTWADVDRFNKLFGDHKFEHDPRFIAWKNE